MSIKGLTIIGESINDSVPSTQKLFDAEDMEGLKALARSQDLKGAAYIDVNVGRRPPEFMARMVREIQSVTAKPLSIDSPDAAIAEAGLRVYDPAKAEGQRPILNSISLLRTEMFDLYAIQPFMPILLVSEHVVNGQPAPSGSAAETHAIAREIIGTIRRRNLPIPLNHCIVDPGIAPIGTDMEGLLKRLLDGMALIHADPELAGVHMSVGLSNFTVMLPSKRADGSPVKSALESAFLTKAVPLGLDMIVGSMARKYEILDASHPALVCLEDCLRLGGFDSLGRIQEFYS
ncbi:dihydropteroate synthase [bacterium]|nr:dihydropteroate synthase [bacterium]